MENNNSGRFQKGSIPWNKNKKGIHLSRKSEFKKGIKPVNTTFIGDTRIRKDRYGTCRVFIKIGDDNWIARAIFNYENKFGKISKGMILHHKNHDSMDDNIDNLQLLTRSEHIKIHHQDLLAAKKSKRKSK